MDLEEVQVAAYLRDHPDFLQRWLERNTEKGSPEKDAAAPEDEQPKTTSVAPTVTVSLDLSSLNDKYNQAVKKSQNSDSDEDPDDTMDMEDEPSPSVVPRTARKSVTSDLFHQWLALGSQSARVDRSMSSPGDGGGGSAEEDASPSASSGADAGDAPGVGSIGPHDTELLAQNDKLMELILDISSEMDINVLCHKILVNVCRLTKADRSSLFLARGPRGKRHLEAKLFDVKVDTNLDEAMGRAYTENISIPFGVGICGSVAETKETIYIRDAYNDTRFNREVDAQTGYTTHSLVSMPVCNADGEVIGVAQIMNKTGNGSDKSQHEFSDTDLKVFRRYLTFCGIGLQNAQLFEVSILEYKKNKLLLSLAKSLFEEQVSLERLVSTIITEAKSLLKCDRCTVYLLDLRMYDEIEDANFFVDAAVRATGGAGSAPGTSCKSPSSVNSSGGGGNATAAVVGGQAPTEVTSDVFVFPNVSVTAAVAEDAQSTCSDDRGSVPGHSYYHHEAGQHDKLNEFLEETEVKYERVWELTSEEAGNGTVRVYGPKEESLLQSRRAKIAKYVAATAEVLNLSSVANWLGEKLEDKDGFVPKTMLCLPIYNGQSDVIGVAQLINKNNGSAFKESDIALFEAFAIFCGIGIHNTKMYEGAIKLMAKQKVALDCLSYHASASQADTDALAKAVIPSADTYSLHSYKFNDMKLPDYDTYKATVRMFIEFGLVKQFNIPYKILCRWVLSVKKNYRPVSYHNWRHALNVCQTMFTVLRTGKMDRFMDEVEIFGLLVACLCHDLDHRGTNNAFQSKVESPLAILYSTSTMEHHHFDQCVMILSSEGNNIFQGLNTEDYRRVMKVVEQAILSTDLALYFRKKDRFLETANCGEIDWQEQEKKELLCGMLMTACDVSAIAKPWEQQHLLAKRVADEFFDQGDLEKLRLNTQPIAMMDRDRKDELPKMQVEFIDVVCKPLFTSLSESFPWIKPLLDGCLSNREKWTDLAEKVEMGLTWIDHDIIEKPIEEITLGTEEAVDIEFTVETLKSSLNEPQSASTGLLRMKPITKKRSFRTTSNKSNKSTGGSFFHRRLSSKSPHRGHVSSITTSEIQIDGGSSSSGCTSLKINQESPVGGSGGGAGSASEDDNVSNNGGSSQKPTASVASTPNPRTRSGHLPR